MDTLNTYRQIIENVLNEYALIHYAHGDIHDEAVFDRQNDRYLIVSVGWDDRRVHDCLIHIDIIDGKVWIQRTERKTALPESYSRPAFTKIASCWDLNGRRFASIRNMR